MFKTRRMWAKVKTIYFHHPSQGTSTNYYLILGLRDKAAPPTSQQINKFPPKRVKNLATPSSIFIFMFSSSTGELCPQPIRGNDRRIGRMFPEHVERSFLDPEYSFAEYFQLGSRRKFRPTSFAEYFELGSRRNICPIKILWGMIKVYWLDFSLHFRSCCLLRVCRKFGPKLASHYKPFENEVKFGLSEPCSAN